MSKDKPKKGTPKPKGYGPGGWRGHELRVGAAKVKVKRGREGR